MSETAWDSNTLPALDTAAAEPVPLLAAEAVVAGHICLDVIPLLVGGAVQFTPGHTVEAGSAIFATGGAVSYTGLALHKLVVPTRLMGKVGDDLFVQAILRIIAAHGRELAAG